MKRYVLPLCLWAAAGLAGFIAVENRACGQATPPVAPETPATKAQEPKAQDKKPDEKTDKKPQETSTPAPPGPKPGQITVSGLLDFYYGINFRRPGNDSPENPYRPAFSGVTLPNRENIRIDNALRFNDINDRELSFSLGEIDITRTQDRKLPLGFRATFTVGEEPRIFHATEPGDTNAWQTFHNLYLSHTFRAANRDVEVNAGIWASPIGIEVLESTGNENYSRSLLFVLTPFYHAGARIKFPLTPKIGLEAAVVNGWNNIADDNNGKSGYLQMTIKPNPRFTQIFNFIGGPEGTGAYGPVIAPKNRASIDTYLLDADSIYQITSRFKVSGWISWGSGAGSVSGQHISGSWLGLAAFARYQLTPRYAAAGRLEQFEDYPGVGGVGLRFGGGYTKYRSATLTLEHASFGGRLLTRLEYRHDWANAPLFGAGATGTSLNQDTLTLSGAIKF